MIERFVASRRKVTSIVTYPTYNQQHKKPPHIGISGIVPSMMSEANRRDAICKALGRECLYKVGDIVECWSPSAVEEMGDCRVTYIADTYAKLGKHNVWPADDTPMIVSIWSLKQEKQFVCNPTFVKKKVT